MSFLASSSSQSLARGRKRAENKERERERERERKHHLLRILECLPPSAGLNEILMQNILKFNGEIEGKEK